METMKIHRKNIEIFEEIIENPRNPMVNLFRNLSKGQVGGRPAGDRAAQRVSELGRGGRGGAFFRGFPW